jgi:hypothetical protein
MASSSTGTVALSQASIQSELQQQQQLRQQPQQHNSVATVVDRVWALKAVKTGAGMFFFLKKKKNLIYSVTTTPVAVFTQLS